MMLPHCTPISPKLSSNLKVSALESTLQQCVVNFRDLLTDYEQLISENESNKQHILELKNKCESKTCAGCVELKNIISSKERIIQSIATSLTKLNDTKDWDVIGEIFKILFEETPTSNSTDIKPKVDKISPKKEIISPKLDVSITEDVSFNEDTSSEIEGTPGRTSPIIQTKKTRSFAAKTESRDKKKCPANWPTPESKSMKLIYPTPTRSKAGKYRQSRISLVRLKHTSVVDLTCSPEASGGGTNVLPLVKKESIENDDTILPSPTSGPTTSFDLLKTASKTIKESTSKFKRPLSLKTKSESIHYENKDTKIDSDITAMEDSINILNPHSRFNGVKKEVQMEIQNIEADENATYCENNSSLSLLDHVNKLESQHKSPPKRPLEDNINVVNTPLKQAIQATEQPTDILDKAKRKIPELLEPIYKEATVRNKQEKRNLQGWSCEQCKKFYGELYKNDPVMLAKKINECSKHRGRHNPERPKTPPNFWNPRWEVPTDTEEFNRMNNAN